jgi:LysM repeat protein
MTGRRGVIRLLAVLGLLAAAGCAGAVAPLPPPPMITPTVPPTEAPTSTPDLDATPLPTREPFGVGHTLPYVAQTGDTLAAIAAHFNTTPEEVLRLNPTLPPTQTVAPGLPLTIPAYWFALGGSTYQIIPPSRGT